MEIFLHDFSVDAGLQVCIFKDFMLNFLIFIKGYKVHREPEKKTKLGEL